MLFDIVKLYMNKNISNYFFGLSFYLKLLYEYYKTTSCFFCILNVVELSKQHKTKVMLLSEPS